MCRFEVSRNLLDELKQVRLKLWKKWTEINSEQIWEDMVPAGWRFFARCFHHRKCKAWDFFWHNIWLGTNFQPFHMQAWNEVPRTSGEDGRPKFLVAWSIVWFRRHTPKKNCHVLQSRRLWWTATNFARSNQQCDQKGCRGKCWKALQKLRHIVMWTNVKHFGTWKLYQHRWWSCIPETGTLQYCNVLFYCNTLLGKEWHMYRFDLAHFVYLQKWCMEIWRISHIKICRRKKQQWSCSARCQRRKQRTCDHG